MGPLTLTHKRCDWFMVPSCTGCKNGTTIGSSLLLRSVFNLHVARCPHEPFIPGPPVRTQMQLNAAVTLIQYILSTAVASAMTLSKRCGQQGSELNRAQYSVAKSTAVTSQFLAVYDLANPLALCRFLGICGLPCCCLSDRILSCLIECRRCDPESCHSLWWIKDRKKVTRGLFNGWK